MSVFDKSDYDAGMSEDQKHEAKKRHDELKLDIEFNKGIETAVSVVEALGISKGLSRITRDQIIRQVRVHKRNTS